MGASTDAITNIAYIPVSVTSNNRKLHKKILLSELRGNQGNQGNQGSMGLQGNQGVAGGKGAKGSMGLQGNQGTSGVSVIASGYTPTTNNQTITPISGMTYGVYNNNKLIISDTGNNGDAFYIKLIGSGVPGEEYYGGNVYIQIINNYRQFSGWFSYNEYTLVERILGHWHSTGFSAYS